MYRLIFLVLLVIVFYSSYLFVLHLLLFVFQFFIFTNKVVYLDLIVLFVSLLLSIFLWKGFGIGKSLRRIFVLNKMHNQDVFLKSSLKKEILELGLKFFIILMLGQFSYLFGIVSKVIWENRLNNYKKQLESENYPTVPFDIKRDTVSYIYAYPKMNRICEGFKKEKSFDIERIFIETLDDFTVHDMERFIKSHEIEISEIQDIVLNSNAFSRFSPESYFLTFKDYFIDLPDYLGYLKVGQVLSANAIIKCIRIRRDCINHIKTIFDLSKIISSDADIFAKISSIMIDDIGVKTLMILKKYINLDFSYAFEDEFERILASDRISDGIKNEIVLNFSLKMDMGKSSFSFFSIEGIGLLNRIKIVEILKGIIEKKDYPGDVEEMLAPYPYYITKLYNPSLKGKNYFYEKNLKNLVKAYLLYLRVERYYREKRKYPSTLENVVNISEKNMVVDEYTNATFEYWFGVNNFGICFMRYDFKRNLKNWMCIEQSLKVSFK